MALAARLAQRCGRGEGRSRLAPVIGQVDDLRFELDLAPAQGIAGGAVICLQLSAGDLVLGPQELADLLTDALQLQRGRGPARPSGVWEAS